MYNPPESVLSSDLTQLKEVQSQSLVRIVDDDSVVLKSYEFMLRVAGWRCRTFCCAEDFLDSNDMTPGCLILDVRLPNLSGLQLQRRLEIIQMTIPIIFVTGHGDVDMAVQALRKGAKDFLIKPVDPKRLKDSVFECCSLDIAYNKEREKNHKQGKLIQSLTQRELEVVRLLAQGLIYKQVAERLGCTERTVKFHKANVSERLGAKSIAEIVKILKDIL